MQRQHFLVLDGLRGIAALVIVVFHFMEWLIPDFKNNFIGHGFLAVDFFFCLSGFVIGYAYDQRIMLLGKRRFFLLRLIRLHPLVVIGSLLGLVGMLWAPFAATPAAHSTADLVTLFLCSIFLLPYPVLADKAYNLFSLNAPAWSLFWEYVANIAYALFLARIGRGVLGIILVIAAVALLYVAQDYGNLLGGWSKDNWEVGGIRLAYSFCAGLWIYRNQWIIKNKWGYLLPALLLLMALCMPYFSINWLAESLVVLFYFPLIIALGAGTSIRAGVQSACRFLGEISYPLYMTHYAALWVFGDYLASAYYRTEQVPYIVVLGTLGLLAFAYLIMRYVDTPLRKYLTQRYLQQA